MDPILNFSCSNSSKICLFFELITFGSLGCTFKFTTAEDNRIMPEFHSVEWDKKLSVISKFKDERLQYFGKKLLYMEKPELLSKEEYNLLHKDTAKKLLSTNNEKWNTIPRTYSEIDTLRAKFEKQDDKEKLKILDDINAYVEDLEKHYSSA